MPPQIDEPEEEEHGEADWDKWYDLDERERWRLAMDGLKSNEGCLEMAPDDWESYKFGDGITAFDLYEIVHSEEIASAVAEEGRTG